MQKIRYLGSPAGDTFTYIVGTRFSTTFTKGQAVPVPPQFADELLKSPAFELVNEDSEKPKPSKGAGKKESE